MSVDTVGLAVVGVGSIFLYAGIKGKSVPSSIQALIQGKSLSTAAAANPIGVNTTPTATSSGASITPGSNVFSSALAVMAEKYLGHAYLYGGAPGVNGSQAWDCSSFINWVVGHDAKLAIPGYAAGAYTGSVHGPATTEWGIWSGMSHISAGEVQAGDIIVWTGHMGMATSNTSMVSALNPGLGTLVTPIAGYGNGPLMCYGRL
jgi:cell wall-associated NlpC family hydrolase